MQKRSGQSPYLATKKSHTHIQLEDVSEQNSKTEKNPPTEEVIPQEIQEELELNLQKYSQQIKEQIRYLLLDLLKYPSSAAAQRHRASNRLGAFDLKQIKNKQSGSIQYFTSQHPPQVCEDCQLAVQQRQIAVCASVWEFPKAGEAAFHLFENVKLLAAQVFLLGAFFSIFSLYVSINQPTQSFSTATMPRKVSYSVYLLYSSSNAVLDVLLGVLAILIVISTIAWWFLQFVSQCLRQKYERIVEQEDLSAADFTIMLDNVPAYYTKERLQSEFNRYFESLVYHHNLKKTWGEDLKPFEIDRVSQVVPFFLSEGEMLDEQLQGLDRDLVEMRCKLAVWMRQFKQNSRFTFQKSDRRRTYDYFEKMLERRKNKIQEMENKAREHYKLPKSKDLKTIYFVTFKHSQSANIIEQLNPQSFPAKIRYFISCCRSAHYFSIRDQHNNEQINITASRAPAPHDVVWGNLKAPLKARVLSRLLTWAVIVALWGATFGVCYGFNTLGIQNGLSFMPIILAIIVTIFNMLIKFFICILSAYERDGTDSDRQRGILIKSLIALTFNWIFTPVIITLVVNLNFYYGNGTVYFIFFLAITNALVPPLLRLFDPYHFYRKLRALWKDRPYKKMELRQSELNAFLENEQYEVGWCYVYYIDLFYFTCFYAPMMPALVVSTLTGYFFMFWVEKYVLLHRSKRPPQNMKTLTSTAQTAMLLGPLIMGIGGFIWVCVFTLDFKSLKFIMYMVQMGLGLLYFVTPYKAIFKCFCSVPQQENMLYQQCRTKLAAEYERLNPVTAEKGTAEYIAFLQKKKEEKAQAMNISEGNLMQHLDISLMIDGMTKIPNIFGKNTEITRKIDGQNLVKSRAQQKKQQIIFVTPAQNTVINAPQNQHLKEIEDLQAGLDVKLSRAETEKKAMLVNEKTMVVNFNSSGNAYSRKKAHQQRRTISVLQEASYDPILETQSLKH